jgi:hypothetical protein
MKLKTSELQGAALDWAVANCEGKTKLYQIRRGDSRVIDTDHPEYFEQYKRQHDEYSTDWAQGGPIIEREKISVFMDDEKWAAYSSHSLPQNFYGTSKDPDWDDGDEGYPLVAAMRCYVASVLGDEVEVPDELA